MSTTLSAALIGDQGLVRKSLLVLGGSLFIAVAAQVSVPMIPVPMTLQTLAVLIVGLLYGARLGAATLVAYLVEGAMGLPVFANGANGAAFFGPTAGFLLGFVPLAWLAGHVSDRGIRGLVPVALCCLVLSALIYVPGVAWAMGADAIFGFDAARWGADSLTSVWTYYMAPFLIGDAVKSVIAAMVVAGGWAVVSRRKGA
jgi:biotin transport system substrate-specific component